MDPCVICNNEVGNADKAMECSICERWEHITCVKRRDRPDDELYEAMVRCLTSRSILYVCSPCRKMGSIAKRFACNDLCNGVTLTVICIDTYCKVTVCILVIMYACTCVRGGVNKNKKIEHTLTVEVLPRSSSLRTIL